MTKFELARTAGRWRPRSRTYVALAILFVTACSTNAKDLTLPDPKLTPRAIRHDLSKKGICATKWGKDQRYVTEKMKREVYHAYAHLMGTVPQPAQPATDHAVVPRR